VPQQSDPQVGAQCRGGGEHQRADPQGDGLLNKPSGSGSERIELQDLLDQDKVLHHIFADFPGRHIDGQNGQGIGNPTRSECDRQIDPKKQRATGGQNHLKGNGRRERDKQSQGQSPSNGSFIISPEHMVKNLVSENTVKTGTLQRLSQVLMLVEPLFQPHIQQSLCWPLRPVMFQR